MLVPPSRRRHLFLEKSKELGAYWHGIHVNLSYVGLGLVALHFGGLFKQEFIRRDRVLYRMLPFMREKQTIERLR